MNVGQPRERGNSPANFARESIREEPRKVHCEAREIACVIQIDEHASVGDCDVDAFSSECA
jgi:hypothetical protein